MPITVISQSARAAGLDDAGAVARPLGATVARTRCLDIPLEGAGDNQTGLWECSPGRFERQLANAEVMHVLSGVCTFTPAGGEPVEIRAGDTLFFPADTAGVWEISETLRKVYVVMA
ncbi:MULTISPECIES: cupin domain-containing protein [Burkholderia]|uniref:Cupin n=1 Tax=Burkholderia savannae TaxID=1637837 RepID=A0ABR5T438_9BURK|nr:MULTISPECIES: cupin domain-containing protein [Burkholderia]AOJ71320.1 cupin [Burkholderia savannae]AOJ84060.1 cupin [Burkholderia savannae]AOK49715.1 cupin [Burkholderia sp. MSMB617WGS]KGR95701.1 cupin domain protein [Burkholderia sp. ABCPW 111]KVG40339.1 cupin [Burkholderia sp. MSMB0265]